MVQYSMLALPPSLLFIPLPTLINISIAYKFQSDQSCFFPSHPIVYKSTSNDYRDTVPLLFLFQLLRKLSKATASQHSSILHADSYKNIRFNYVCKCIFGFMTSFNFNTA